MDSFIIFWGLLIMLTISVIVGLIYLAYWLPKRFGKRRLGFWLSGTLVVGLSIIILVAVSEDQLFLKSDVTERLSEHKIELKDDFKLNSNEMGGLMDYHHRFVLTISPEDKERLKTKILTANNYKDNAEEEFDLRQGKPRYSNNDTAFTANYQDRWNYIYEHYKPNRQGQKPIWDRISVSKTDNKLTYQRILD